MKLSRGTSIAFVLLALLATTSLFAVDIPLNNWTVPPYRSSSARGGITTMGDVTSDIGFVGVTPCRLVDTRTTTSPNFPVPYGPPNLGAGSPRNFDLNDDPKCTGIPAGVEAYSLNITVTNTQGDGFILIYPQGGTQPTVSTLNYKVNQTVANAAIVPAGTGGGVTVIAGVSGTDLIIDINGYFSGSLNPGNEFVASGNVDSFVFFGITFPGTTGQFTNQSTTWSYGVRGTSSSTTNFGAGVAGSANGGDPSGGTCADCRAAGVRGGSVNGPGVLGMSRASGTAGGVSGVYMNSTGNAEYAQSVGILAYDSVTGVHAVNNITKGGLVSFTEPHATDASKKVVYVALEGNEAGTYFRGRAKFQNGVAAIDLPEDFRMVTLPEGLSIQVTPIGEMATVAVASIGLDRIVVRGSRNVEFFYTVNGIRRGYGDFQPIVANDKDYLPASADARLPDLRPEIKNRLIANGTYRPDGTVNTETATRLGWDRIWAERERPQPAPVAQP